MEAIGIYNEDKSQMMIKVFMDKHVWDEDTLIFEIPYMDADEALMALHLLNDGITYQEENYGEVENPLDGVDREMLKQKFFELNS